MVRSFIAAVLPAVCLVSGLVAGAAAGATAGFFNKKSPGLGSDDLEKMSNAIKDDQAPVLTLADIKEEAKGLVDILTQNAGKNAGSEWITEEGLAQADEVVAQVNEE